MLSFFPRGVLDEILNLIESVSEGFPSCSCDTNLHLKDRKKWTNKDKKIRAMNLNPAIHQLIPDMYTKFQDYSLKSC